MTQAEIILIALGLSMDAFAVSVTLGLSVRKPPAALVDYLIPGIYFGFFQALMPLAGYLVGTRFAGYMSGVDHWIAFVLLGFIGGKMIWESLSKDKEADSGANPLRPSRMFTLAIATSIDALAAGVTFALFEINIIAAIAIIGLTTFVMSIVGVKVGKIFGARFKSKAEFIGGAVLVGLGVKILVENLIAA